MLPRSLFPFSSTILPLLLLPIVLADADFLSVRTRMTQDHSTKPYDPSGKYFHESIFHEHYDGRFSDTALSDADQRARLGAAVRAYLGTMADLGLETWIMHGSLLGWWWNRKIMPWDSDVDVQVSWPTMRFLAGYYNMTVHGYWEPGSGVVRNYLLEINPRYAIGSTQDWMNMIDARWIDIETGVFIDITTVRPKKSYEGVLIVKDTHQYKEEDLFPLLDGRFEGKPVKIPRNYAGLLEDEYGIGALMDTSFEEHVFDSDTLEWVREPNSTNPDDAHAEM